MRTGRTLGPLLEGNRWSLAGHEWTVGALLDDFKEDLDCWVRFRLGYLGEHWAHLFRFGSVGLGLGGVSLGHSA